MADSPVMPVVRSATKVAVGVALLLLVRLAVSNLPMLNETVPLSSAYVTYGTLVIGAVNTALFVLLFRFGSELRSGVLVPAVPEAGRIAQLTVWLLTLAFAYVAYGEIAAALFGTNLRVYQFAFVVMAVANVVAIGALIFRNLDAFTDVTMRAAQTMRERARAVASVHPQSVLETPPSQEITACPKCSRGIVSTQRFCRSCGAALQSI